MIIKASNKRQIKSFVLLSIILVSLIGALILPMIPTNSPAKVNESSADSEELDEIPESIEQPKASILGNDTWWDTDWNHRRIIKVENPYPLNFTDYGVNFTFNYEELDGQIQENLNDLRIVENGTLRNYYVVKDYPDPGYTTVWFDTNISQSTNETDTYMYYGNPSVGPAMADDTDETMGWVKNGDFELDGDDADLKFIPFGWNFTDDPVDEVADLKNPGNGMIPLASPNTHLEAHNNSVDSYNAFVFKLTGTPQVGSQEGLGNGDYAYKWGPNTNNVEGGTTSSHEYAGTLYSYPFKVPKVEGGDIKLKFWRNARTYIFEMNEIGGAAIDYDGYFIRVCNGSAGKYTYEVDDHENAHNTNFDNYLEAYGGKSDFKGNVWKWVNILRGHFADSQDEKDTGPAAELTNYVEIDISQYEGKEIFLEFGSWGQENGDDQQNLKRSGFFQLDYVRFNYHLTATLDELQNKNSDVNVVAVDVDGRVVPNAEIFIVNNSAAPADLIVKESVATDGTALITGIPRGRYNITANYTLGGQVVEVFNSYQSGEGPYYFNGINYTVQIKLDIWTIDFEIVDWDGIPLKYGYIEVNESKGSNWIANLTLDENGKATFRWRNDTRYYYKVWYDNDDYATSPIGLNDSYVYRSNYIPDNVKYTHHTINVNETHVGSYSISERIYTNYLNSLGNKKVIQADIALTDMVNYLTDVSIYYIDEDNLTTGNRIYYEEYDPGDAITADTITLDISLIDNDNLKSDNFEVYGLLLEINGANFSKSDGKIQVDLIETCNEYNRTALARLNITTVYWNDISKELEDLSAFVRVNTTDTASLVNLTSTADAIPPAEDGMAYGIINQVPLWYFIGRSYNFTIDVANETFVDFNVNETSDASQWRPVDYDKVKVYNFTLYKGSYLIFKIIPKPGANFTTFKSKINQSFALETVYWGDQIDIWAIFLSTDDNWATWDYVSPPGSCSVVIKLVGTDDVLFDLDMQYTGSDGNYTLLFDSKKLSAGSSSNNYIFEIIGYHPTYDNPTSIAEYVEIRAITTGMSIHDYEDNYAIETDETFEIIYGEFLNISIRYYILSTNVLLDEASVTYRWIGFGPSSIAITIDPANPDYFTFLIDSGLAPSAGIREIEITCLLENYSLQVFDINIDIDPRPTLLNGKSNPLSVDWKIWVKDAEFYTFIYTDANTGDKLDNAFDYSYEWYVGGVKVDDGDLIKNADDTYTLDFDTETRAVGDYIIKVELEQENYEDQDLEIRLEIMLRTFDVDVDANNYEDDQVTVVHGKKIKLEVTLIDESRGIPLVGATVKLDIGGKKYEFDDDGNGDYTLTYETDDLDAFFTSKTMTGEITIKKVDFVSDEIDITFVITMEEIFDGMPTFYFIMIVSAISAVVCSLVGYRVIQQARIPKHVKKIRLIKKKIKARDSIPSISILTKEQMIMKQFGGAWKDLDLALEDTLGIKEVKSKIPAEEKKSLKQKGGDV